MRSFRSRKFIPFGRHDAPARKRAGVRPSAAAETLEDRVLLTAGDITWNLPYDIRATGLDSFDDVAVQADGKIVAVGRAEFSGTNHFLIARFHANGALDTSFSDDGIRVVQFSGRGSVAKSVVIRPNGKIVVGGFSSESGDSNADVTLVQLNANGSTDLSFGTFGVAIWHTPATSEGFTIGKISLTPDGKIVASGFYLLGGSVGYLARFTASGALDLTFDGDGFKTFNKQVVDATVDPAGRIVALSNDGTVYRVLPTGAFDTSFSGDGVLSSLSPDAGFNPTFTTLDIDSEGRIVIGGNSSIGGLSHPTVFRLLPNGLYDASFDGNGRRTFSITGATASTLRDLLVQPDGSIFVAGQNAIGHWFIALLTPSGEFNDGFSGDGQLMVDAGDQDFLHGIATTPTGDVILVGRVDHAGTDSSSAIARVEGLRAADDLVGYYGGEWQVGRSTTTSFVTSTWANWADVPWNALRHGDFNGDGNSDVLGLINGNWWIGLATGTGYQTSQFGAWSNVAWQHVTVADMNNDGLDDILAFYGGQWWGADSQATSFKTATVRATWANIAWHDVAVVELTGDGRKDLIGRTGGQWWVSTGGGLPYDSKFFNTSLWATWADAAWTARLTADVTGDGLADLVGLINGQWYVGVSTGSSFATSHWASWANVLWTDVRTGDFNGDGRDDIVARLNTQWWVGLSGGTSFVTSLWMTLGPAPYANMTVGDFNGDGRDDIAVRGFDNWIVGRSTGSSFVSTHWAYWADVEWQAVAAVEASSNTGAVMGPISGPGLAATALSEESPGSWSIWNNDDELAALLLAG